MQVAITSSAARTFRSFSARVLAVLAIAAALMGLFALHAMTDHDTMTSGSMSAGISHADPAGAMTDPAPITPTVPVGVVVPVAAAAAAAAALALPLIQEMGMANMQGCPGCAMQCAIYAMSCVILIVLSLLVLFARFPLTGSAATTAMLRLLPVLHAARRRLLRPSLIALSISRT